MITPIKLVIQLNFNDHKNLPESNPEITMIVK